MWIGVIILRRKCSHGGWMVVCGAASVSYRISIGWDGMVV